jgi:transcriptional regulator with XRE-family HTH domain
VPEDGILCVDCLAAEPAGTRRGPPLPGLRAARRRAALTQAQLAERAAVGVSTVAHLEAGARPAAIPTLQKVAAALGVAPAELTRPADGSPGRARLPL